MARIIRWSTYSVAFALLPLLSVGIIRFLNGVLTWHDVLRSSEVLFFCLMVSATSLADLTDVRVKKEHDHTVLLLRSALLVAAILSAVLYGSAVNASIHEEADGFATRLLWVSSALTVASVAVAFVAQLFLARIGK